jgi:hypothetical protein
MCISSKESLLAGSILIGISIALYIRNGLYDRIIALLFIVISMVQFVELLFHTKNILSKNAGRALYIILWLECLVLACGLYYHFETNLTLIWMSVFTVVFIIAVIYAFNTKFTVTKQYGHLVWSQANTSTVTILGNYRWVYLAGIFLPFIIIQYYSNWKDWSMWILFSVIVLSALVVSRVYPDVSFSSMWCYSATTIIFTAWLIGAFKEHESK